MTSRSAGGFTRREFGQLALAGIPLALTTRLDAAAVRIGVQSYSFRAMSLEDAVAAMKQIGLKECELFAAMWNRSGRRGPPRRRRRLRLPDKPRRPRQGHPTACVPTRSGVKRSVSGALRRR
jgi:hypothetical protein